MFFAYYHLVSLGILRPLWNGDPHRRSPLPVNPTVAGINRLAELNVAPRLRGVTVLVGISHQGRKGGALAPPFRVQTRGARVW